MENNEDNYELICNPTDDGNNDARENVLVSENKNIIGDSLSINYNFNDFFNSIFFQILVAIIIIYLINYLWQFSINLVSNKKISIALKGGKK